MTERRRDSGFTLIEVMVALAIFAVLSVTLLVRMGDNIRAEESLQSRTLAALVAENTLTELRLSKDWDELADRTESVELAGMNWQVRIRVAATPNEDLRRVDVKVGLDQPGQRDDSSIFTLTSYIGKH